MRILAIFALTCVLGSAQDFERAWRGERLTIRVRAGVVGNLAWQLDTLSGHSNTKPKDYEDLWHNDLAWKAEDARMLGQWAALHKRYRYRKTRARRAQTPYPQNYGRFYGNSVAHDYAFRIAALDAGDLADVRQRYRKLCGRKCADGFVEVLQHFWPRFAAWWREEGVATSALIIPQIVAKMSDFGLGELCEAEITMTSADLPAGHEVFLDMAVHPKKYLTNYTATVMDNHILSEIVDDADVGGPRLPLVVHELAHHFYDFARRVDHTWLVAGFAVRPEPYWMAAYSVLNEALAVSFQLLAEKRLRSEEDYRTFIAEDDYVYFDPFMAKAGRALAPVAEEWLRAGRNIFDEGFVDAYMRAAGAALGPLIESPRFLLSTPVLIAGPAGQVAKDEFNRSVRAVVGQDDWSDLKAYSVVAEVTHAAESRESFCFAWRRSSKAVIYFIYGRDVDRLLAATRMFVKSDAAFSGLRTIW